MIEHPYARIRVQSGPDQGATDVRARLFRRALEKGARHLRLSEIARKRG